MWWQQRARAGAAAPRCSSAGGALAIVGALSFCCCAGSGKPTLPGGAQQSRLPERLLRHARAAREQAPPIHLRNYLGRRSRCPQYRGKAVLVTFLYTHCPDICPLITSNLRVTLNMLGAQASQAQIIAVSVDPRGDTPAASRTSCASTA